MIHPNNGKLNMSDRKLPDTIADLEHAAVILLAARGVATGDSRDAFMTSARAEVSADRKLATRTTSETYYSSEPSPL